MHDLRILSGTVVSDHEARLADVAIEGGFISEVGPQGTLGPAAEEIDASGLLVLPGAVDVHFHCRAPSHPERGDFASETRAAASGGVTTVFEMPISDPACSTPEVLRARRELGEEQSYVNFALFAGGAVESESHAQAMAESGAIGFKLFTHSPPASRVAEFAGLWAIDEGGIFEAFSAIRATGLVCVVHAENEALLKAFARQAELDGVPRRPPVIEAAAIALVGALAAETGTRVHVAHVTSRAAIAALVGTREMGASISAETCPQYLVFDRSAIQRVGAFAKVAPPLRTPEDAEALWEALRGGAIGMVASDHAPFLPHEKEVDYASAPQGLPTIETMVPILLDAAARGLVPLTLAVDLVTSNPSQLFGLYPRKGTISSGADADVVLFDPKSEMRLSVESLLSRAAGCGVLYEGMALRGRILRTIVGGQTVYAEGKMLGPRCGRFVQPEFSVRRPA